LTRYLTHPLDEDGWTEWIHPLPGYKFRCCDCGLVHELEFRAREDGEVVFRARRNDRSTGQVRRHQNIKVTQTYA
jgi:hypothetical protein